MIYSAILTCYWSISDGHTVRQPDGRNCYVNVVPA